MADSTTIRVGIVGTGVAGRFHVDGYRRVHGAPVEVVGVYSRNPKRRKAFAGEHGLRAFDTVDGLIEAVDLVSVCTPPYAHAPVAEQALELGRHVVVEKPFCGAYGTGRASFRGDRSPKRPLLEQALAACDRVIAAGRRGRAHVCYAENWVYSPAIQKEREILVKSGGQILWMLGEESHSGSHAPSYGVWAEAGGGSLVGKGCHPLTAALYLKQEEGRANGGRPIRPASVSARTHELTRERRYRDEGFLRTDYLDVEDYSQAHVVFEDGTRRGRVLRRGRAGRHQLLARGAGEQPPDQVQPQPDRRGRRPTTRARSFSTTSTSSRRSAPSRAGAVRRPDEDWMNGYPQQFQDFVEAAAEGREPLCGGLLARDTVAVMYSAYVSAERNGAEVRVPRHTARR